jgi:hypothetical protein
MGGMIAAAKAEAGQPGQLESAQEKILAERYGFLPELLRRAVKETRAGELLLTEEFDSAKTLADMDRLFVKIF